MRSSTIRSLRALLARERDAVLCAQFSELESLSLERENLLAKLSPSEEPSELREVVRLTARNQELLLAAISGIRVAEERLRTILQIGTGLETYDKSGQRLLLGKKIGKLSVKT